MKKTTILITLLLNTLVISQTKAVTENGKEVVLFENGTWKFVNESDVKSLETIITNETIFEKSRDATFLIKSKKIDAGLYFNPIKWKIATNTNKALPYSEYIFTHQNNLNNVMALMSTENIPISTFRNLKELILSNIQKNADYFRLKDSEYRTVNGLKVLYLRYALNTKGIDFEYAGYYYMNDEGYTGVIGFTSQRDFEKYLPEILKLINGISKAERQEGNESLQYTSPPPPMRGK
ncbi:MULTISPECIES: hypothetical protein [Chryseobacterium]|uniref:hypothetical protein n=1 Tax=Chryseobacterium sp. R2A-55 TaxID=2744445 RepID=UPI001F45B9C3|nr:hypothetical protein [Chryseobacterium sp. R2A-55]